MMCIIPKNVSLLPWVVCVSGISSYFDDGSCRLYRSISVELWNALMKHCEVELWTTEMSFQYNVRLMNDIRLWIFCYWMNTFIKTFILFTKWDVIASTITDGTFFVIRPSSSSFATWSTNTLRRNDEDFHIKTTAKTLDRDWQHFESTPRNCITLWTVTVNYLWYCYCDNPLRYVTTHLSHRTLPHFIHCRELIFFITDTYPTGIFYHSTTLPKLLLTTSNYLTIR